MMPDPFKILYNAYGVHTGDPIHLIVQSHVPDGFELITLDTNEKSELLEKLQHIDIILTVKIDAEMIAASQNLKLIQLAGVGYDGIDVLAASNAGIPVAQTIEGTITGVAEHTLLLMLALLKHLVEADASVRRGEWWVSKLRPVSYSLYGKTVGIIGLGRIGREVAKRCQAFGAHVIYTDVNRLDELEERNLEVAFRSIDALLHESDIITLHCPLMEENQRFFNEPQFQAMKTTALFINTARGGLVDETALVKALQEGWIAGAGLDVYEHEPPDANHPLLSLQNVILTPHIATGTRDSIIEKFQAACENFKRVSEGKLPLHVINTDVFKHRTLSP